MNEEMANPFTHIDPDNPPPEPTQEYPSHMVEETDEEEITDHQAVADILSNGETYEPVSENREAYQNLTEERLRDVVEEVLEEAAQAESTEPHPTQTLMEGLEANEMDVPEETEADSLQQEEPQPRAVRINMADIPVGMTAEEYIRHYQQTGTLTTNATSTTYTSTNISTDATDGQPFRRDPLDDLFVNKEEKKEPIEEIPPTPEEIARIKAERKEYHADQLRFKREICVRDMVITKDDLIITFQNGSHTFYHIDIEGSHQMQKTANPHTLRRRRGVNKSKSVCNSLIFDKNMNRLTVYKDGFDKERDRRDGTRIYPSQVYLGSEGGIGDEPFFVVINKNAFINSKGRLWQIRYRSHVSYHRIKQAKKMYMGQFDEIERFMSFMKFNIEMVHPAEDYDIMYSFGGQERHTESHFDLLIKFNDVTISNSIEMDHHIGDIIIKSTGNHWLSHGADEIRSNVMGSLSGTRLTFTPGDAGRSYQHSHLTTSMCNFGGFCTGSGNYNNGDGYLTEYSIQEHIFRLDTYVRWESLEGGPHYRMENINIHGGVQPIRKHIIGTDREVRNVYVERLIYEINQTPEQFGTFAPCFTIINQKGNLKFVADYQMFFRKFMEIIPSDKIKEITTQLGETVYTYNSLEGTFHVINDMDSVNPAKIIEKAELKMINFNPIYMSGKYYRPRLITRDVGNLLEGLVFSPEPNIMKEIAQLIMYHLTNKLEKYGNTSADEREES